MNSTPNLNALSEIVRSRLPQGAADASQRRARRLLDERVIESPSHGDFPYRDGKVWKPVTHRATARYLHGFLFLADWPALLAGMGDPAPALGFALGMARTWEGQYPLGATENDMAYHDETTAQRLTNFLALLGSFEAHCGPADRSWVHAFLDRHATLLASEDFHATGTNHGMFQDQALLNYAVLATWRTERDRMDFFELAESRLRDYFLGCFTADGVHIENAPTYHLMISRAVRDHRDLLRLIDHPDAPRMDDLLQGAARYATHAVMPNGVFPPISDTQQLPLKSGTAVFDSPEFAYAATEGREGERPTERVLVLPGSGYAIYRSAWGDPDATFAFFHAAYNADYHKHSDDNSFFLRTRGIDVISEAGPYGYNYQDPLTKYGYSQYAHNTVVAGNASVRRTDNRADEVSMVAESVRESGFRVTGRNGRLHESVHERTLEVAESDGVPRFTFEDTVTSSIDQGFELLWNLGPEVDVVTHGHGFEVFHGNEKLLDAQFTANVPLRVSRHRGETSPQYLGWRFPRFGEAVPANVIRVCFTGTDARIRTEMRLAEFAYRDRGLAAADDDWRRFEGEVGLNYLFVPAKSASGAGHLGVTFTAIHQPGDFTYNYKATLDKTDMGMLYILDDFGDQGAYYLQDHGDRAIFRTVQELISTVREGLGLDPDRLVMLGSSKGGAAALMHGMAAKAGHIFVGAPQTRIGTFIHKPHLNMLEFMTGGTSAEDVEALDKAMFDMAAASDIPGRITLLVGDRDHHYKNHALPFIEHLKALGVDPQLVLLPGLTHANIGTVYREALLTYIQALCADSAESAFDWTPDELARTATGLAVVATSTGSTVTARVLSVSPGQYAFRLYLDAETFANAPYATEGSAQWEDLPPGRYRARVFHRPADGAEPVAQTTNWVNV